MGLFNRKNKQQEQISSANSTPSQTPQATDYKKALSLIESGSTVKGKYMMLDLSETDAQAALWIAKDFEENDCFSSASNYYKRAFTLGAKEAEEGFKRCYNPYHIDPYYSYSGGRSGATPHLSTIYAGKEKQQNDFDDALAAITAKPDKDTLTKCLRTIYQIASAHNGLPAAMQWMGDFCETVEQDLVSAAAWYKKAADNGDPNGARCYADMLMSGRGVTQNRPEAFEYYQKAADKGQADAQFIIGQVYWSSGNKEKGKKYLEMAAEKGYAPAVDSLRQIESGSQAEISVGKNMLTDMFGKLVDAYGLSEDGLVEYIKEIFQPEDFCSKAYDYCNKQYQGKGDRKLVFEYCLTSFYGCICSVALWNRDRENFDTSSAWDSIYKQIDVEFTDVNAEKFLGIERGEDKSDNIFSFINSYFQLAYSVFVASGNSNELAIFAMEYAYRFGMLVAIKELQVNAFNDIREYITKPDAEDDDDDNGEIKSEEDFYVDCVKAFHDEANKYGAATRGLIYIPELIPLGAKTVLAFLQDPVFENEYKDSPETYYYLIASLCIDAGMVYAAKWHEDFAGLNKYVDRIIQEGPAEDANALLKKHFPVSISDNQGNGFFRKIFPVWLKQHQPYWELDDPRNYTYRAMLAAYQLGISMMLEKFGY